MSKAITKQQTKSFASSRYPEARCNNAAGGGISAGRTCPSSSGMRRYCRSHVPEKSLEAGEALWAGLASMPNHLKAAAGRQGLPARPT